jgi:hypothetical protein
VGSQAGAPLPQSPQDGTELHGEQFSDNDASDAYHDDDETLSYDTINNKTTKRKNIMDPDASSPNKVKRTRRAPSLETPPSDTHKSGTLEPPSLYFQFGGSPSSSTTTPAPLTMLPKSMIDRCSKCYEHTHRCSTTYSNSGAMN